MKPLHLNLASRPYRDYRPVYAAAIAMALTTAVLLFLNLQTATQYFRSTSETRNEIARIDANAEQEKKKRESLEATLQRVDFRALNIQTTYINTQLAERAFSWSMLLDQLERVVPKSVRLKTLNPSVATDGTIHLELSCDAKTTDGLVDFLNRLLADPHFAKPFPSSETTSDEGFSRFQLGVDYIPNPPGVTP
ncbi:MAG TPA: PilN domain-containing protein [Thermoanaerobaculia bacterium]